MTKVNTFADENGFRFKWTGVEFLALGDRDDDPGLGYRQPVVFLGKNNEDRCLGMSLVLKDKDCGYLALRMFRARAGFAVCEDCGKKCKETTDVSGLLVGECCMNAYTLF